MFIFIRMEIEAIHWKDEGQIIDTILEILIIFLTLLINN